MNYKNLKIFTVFFLFLVSGCGNKNSKGVYYPIREREPELDFLGMPRLRESDGWIAWESRVKNVINYLSQDVRKVKVRGIYGRYISYKTVLRYYEKPKAATPTEIYSSGYSSIDCFGSGASISCSGYGPSITTIPGDPGSPGGTVQLTGDVVIDCLDNSYQTIYKGVRTGRWNNINDGSHMSSFSTAFCGQISNLPISNISRYEKGSPTKKDFQAIQVLPY